MRNNHELPCGMAAGSLGGEPVRFLPEVLAVVRRRLAVGGLQTIAVLKNHLWRSVLTSITCLRSADFVERRHKLVLRFEQYGVDARKRGSIRP